MFHSPRIWSIDYVLFFVSLILIVVSVSILHAIFPSLFPVYFLYIVVAILSFLFFVKIDFGLLIALNKHIYVVSLFLLTLPLILGEITRGAVRWIPLGPVAIQPSELVRPFLILFFANFLTEKELTGKRIFQSGLLLSLPVFLILIQPSLGVSVLTVVSFVGVILSSTINKKNIFVLVLCSVLALPIIWQLMAPYQKGRVMTFLDPSSDPLGAGYNSIQSMISVGSGGILGRGLGKGVQTQLLFLPERHNDFVFASLAEELGFTGVIFLFTFLFVLLWRITSILENARNPTARAYVSGVFLVLFFQIIFNIGMKMGLFPITGIPLPLVSSGGSSLIATMTALGIVSNSRKY